MADQRIDHRSRQPFEIAEPECRRLLSTSTLGRVGLTTGALPVIIPVEYVFADGDIMFSLDDAKLRSAADGHVLAFEVDAYDTETGEGWSVHVLGRASVLPDDAPPAFTIPDRERCARSKGHFVRLHGEIVAGRTIAHSCN